MREILNYDTVLEAKTAVAKPALLKPRMYCVLLINDDYTPMDFVIGVLKQFFHMPEEQALQIMLQVHTQGKGQCGIFTRDVAETKVQQVNTVSRLNEHPLLCAMEVV
jgi:ATP-dependent Clp protease adaptor protein ClpS